MARPARFGSDLLLDHAAELAAAAGPGAVTMANVARAAGAPSGSVYYRFPSHAALLAALWLRTVGRLQDSSLAAVAAADPSGTDPLAATVAVARHTVVWSRAHVAEAHVLLHGAGGFGADEWRPEDREQSAARRAEVEGLLRDLSRRLGLRGVVDRERLLLAAVDLPYALVRRHLRAGTAIPEEAERLVEETARAILGAVPRAGGGG